MIRVFFFARLREELGVGEVELNWQPQLQRIRDIISLLEEQHDAAFAQRLLDVKTIVACNHEVVNTEATVKDGDEIAFYPPVTGG